MNRGAIHGLLTCLMLFALVSPLAGVLCGGGGLCPMMQADSETRAPCHQGESVSSNLDCCLEHAETKADLSLDQALRPLLIAAGIGSPFAEVSDDQQILRPATTHQALRSRPLFALHSSLLT